MPLLDADLLREIAATEEIHVTDDDIAMFFDNRCWLIFQRAIAKLLDEGQQYLEHRDAELPLIKYGSGIIYAARTIGRLERRQREKVTRDSQAQVTPERHEALDKNESQLLDLLEQLNVD